MHSLALEKIYPTLNLPETTDMAIHKRIDPKSGHTKACFVISFFMLSDLLLMSNQLDREHTYQDQARYRGLIV